MLKVLLWSPSGCCPPFGQLFPDGIDPTEFVKEYMELPKTETLILPGQTGTSLFQGLPNTPVLAFRIKFEPGCTFGMGKC